MAASLFASDAAEGQRLGVRTVSPPLQLGQILGGIPFPAPELQAPPRKVDLDETMPEHWYAHKPLESDLATTFNIMKAIMGAGGFAMPWAFARLGLVGGCIAIGICTGVGWWTIGELVRLKFYVQEQRCGKTVTYVDVAQAALGRTGAYTVCLLTLICALGVTSAYLVFIGAVVHSMYPSVAQWTAVLLAAAMLTPITWMSGFAWLSRLAQFGTLAVISGYGVTLCYGMTQQDQHGSSDDQGVQNFGSPASAATGFGAVAFLFCVHFMLFPVMSASQAETRKGGFQSLAVIAFASAAVINGAFAILCLRFFGASVSSIVVNDIANEGWWLNATKLMLCVDLFCSYPLVFASARQVIETYILDWPDGHEPRCKLVFVEEVCSISGRSCLRMILVAVNVAVAHLQSFGVIISLVGSLGQVSLAFILPPIMSLMLLGDSMPWQRKRINQAILPLGIALATLATGATIAEKLGYDFSKH